MNRILLAFLMTLGLVLTQTTFAQKNYSEGFIITLEHDTIYGRVRDRFPFRFPYAADKVVLMDSNGVKMKYIPREITGYSKAGMVNYLTIQDGLKKSFARLLVDGDIKLLTIRKTNTHTYAMPNGTGGFYTGFGGSYTYDVLYLYKTSTSVTTKVTHLDFKNSMAVYFYDCQPVREMIMNKELRYNDLEIIVEKYNKWKREEKVSNEL